MLKYLAWFNQYWKRTKLTLLGIVLLTILTIAAKIGYPLVLKLVVDELSTDYQINHAYQLVIWFFVLSIARELLWAALPLIRGTLNTIYTAWIRNDYYQKLTLKSTQFFNQYKTGDLLTRLTDDLDGNWVRISWYSCSGIFRPFEAILILGFSLGVMFTYSVELTLYTFLPLPILVYIMHRLDEKNLRYTNEKQKSISRCNNILEACFSGIKVVKTTLSEPYQFNQYEKAIDDRIKKERNFLLINQMVHLFAMMVNHFGTVIVILVGGLYVGNDKISLGTLLMFIMYLRNLIEPIFTLAFFWASSKQIFQYVERVMDIDETKCNLTDHQEGVFIREFEKLELNNVSFAYPQGNEILEKINLKISKGEKVAIMGQVGCGKTSILELISRNLNPIDGLITINGKPVQQVERTSYLRHIGYVRQENILFSESIRKNIVLGDDFTQEDILKAVDESLLKKEVESFQHQYETLVGPKGSFLSGGQKQRLALSRTLIRRPSLLLMDDCTASMDAQTESEFWRKFNQKHKDMSAIIVTHRLSTARMVDKVFVIVDKKLIPIEHEHLEKTLNREMAEALTL